MENVLLSLTEIFLTITFIKVLRIQHATGIYIYILVTNTSLFLIYVFERWSLDFRWKISKYGGIGGIHEYYGGKQSNFLEKENLLPPPLPPLFINKCTMSKYDLWLQSPAPLARNGHNLTLEKYKVLLAHFLLKRGGGEGL